MFLEGDKDWTFNSKEFKNCVMIITLNWNYLIKQMKNAIMMIERLHRTIREIIKIIKKTNWKWFYKDYDKLIESYNNTTQYYNKKPNN
jgi:hypothetical protein